MRASLIRRPGMLTKLILTTFEILQLKRGPQDLPASQTLTIGALLAYFGLNFSLLNTGLPTGQALIHAFLSVAVLGAYTQVVLRWRKLDARFQQTLLGLLVTGVVLGLLTIAPMQALQPFLEALAEMKEGDELLVQPPGWAVLMYAVVGIWHLVVMGHVFRHALDTSLGRGILLTLLYEMLLLTAIRIANAAMGIG